MRVEFIFNDTSIDITDALRFPLAITREISDFRDIGSGRGSKSKTFTLPATKANNKAFASLYELDTDQTDASVQAVKSKVDASILVNDEAILTGYARIKRIQIGLNPVNYQIEVFGDNSDWVSLLNGKYLNELDFGSAVWSKSAIQTVQAQTYPTTDFQYPLADYGSFTYADGVGTEDFLPAPYLCSLITKVFNGIGYSVTSKFMTESDIQGIVYPLVGENWRHSDSAITNRSATISESTGDSYPNQIIYVIDFDTEDSDPSNMISVDTFTDPIAGTHTGNKWSPPNNSIYKISGSIQIEDTFGATNTRQMYLYNANTRGSVFLGEIEIVGSATVIWTIDSEPFEVVGGDDYYIYIAGNTFDIHAGASLSYEIQNEIIKGDGYEVGEVLPKVSQLEFITGIKHLFGLFIDADPISKSVTIEPRNNWRNTANSSVNGFIKPTTSAVDWSDIIDVSKLDVEIVTKSKKTLEYSYAKDGNDKRMEAINETISIPYGAYRHDLEDRFPEGIKKHENKFFAATHYAYNRDLNTSGTRVLTPVLLKEDISTPQDKSYDFKPRLLSYKYTNQANRYGETVTMQFYEDSGAAPTSEETNIPKAFFVNYDSLTDFQLSFGSIGAGVGLFERFHLSTIPEINDGRLIVGKAYLKASDIRHDFRNLIYFDRAYYVLNKIRDYKPTKGDLTAIELVPRNTLVSTGVTAYDDDANKRLAPTATEVDSQIYFEDGDNVLTTMTEDNRGNVTPVLIDTKVPGAGDLIPFSKWQ